MWKEVLLACGDIKKFRASIIVLITGADSTYLSSIAGNKMTYKYYAHDDD